MSALWTIASSVKTVLAALPGFSTAMLKIQKRPFVSADHGHTLPFVSIVIQPEAGFQEAMANTVIVRYRVLVALIQARGALENEAELEWQTDRREDVRKALWKDALSGASGVINTGYEPAPVFDLGGLDQLFDVSLQEFTFHNTESRSA